MLMGLGAMEVCPSQKSYIKYVLACFIRVDLSPPSELGGLQIFTAVLVWSNPDQSKMNPY